MFKMLVFNNLCTLLLVGAKALNAFPFMKSLWEMKPLQTVTL